MCCLLLQSFDELVKLAEKGDRSKVDLTVRDVAGGKYNSVPESCLVSSFGQLAKKPGTCLINHVKKTSWMK
jgi:pantothenate kinase